RRGRVRRGAVQHWGYVRARPPAHRQRTAAGVPPRGCSWHGELDPGGFHREVLPGVRPLLGTTTAGCAVPAGLGHAAVRGRVVRRPGQFATDPARGTAGGPVPRSGRVLRVL